MRKNILLDSKRFSLIVILLVFVSALAFPFIHTKKAYADSPPSQASIKNGQFSWYDRNTIHAVINGVTYYFRAGNVDGGIGGSAYLGYDVKDSDCWGRLRFDSNYPFKWVGASSSSGNDFRPGMVAPLNINADMDFTDPASTSSSCQNTSPNTINVPLSGGGNFNIYFRLSDDGRHLDTVGDDGNNYTQSGKYPDLFTKDSESGDDCQDVIQITSDHKHYKSYEIDKNGTGSAPPSDIHAPNDCKMIGGDGYVKMGVEQLLGNPSAFQNTPNPDPTASGGSGSGDTSLTGCSVTLSSPLSWIICPLIDLGSTTSDYIFSDVATPLLQDVPITTDKTTGVFRAWQGFRFLANIMLIGSMLAIVYTQAKGD